MGLLEVFKGTSFWECTASTRFNWWPSALSKLISFCQLPRRSAAEVVVIVGCTTVLCMITTCMFLEYCKWNTKSPVTKTWVILYCITYLHSLYMGWYYPVNYVRIIISHYKDPSDQHTERFNVCWVAKVSTRNVDPMLCNVWVFIRCKPLNWRTNLLQMEWGNVRRKKTTEAIQSKRKRFSTGLLSPYTIHIIWQVQPRL